MDICPVKCTICLDIMVQACTLQCGHSFCELCIDDAIDRDIRCPRCHQNTDGFGVRNLRLDNLAYNFASQSRLLLNSYNKRKRQNKDAMTIRIRARAILCFVLDHEQKALTIGEIEDELKQLRPEDKPFDNKIIKEILRTTRTNRTQFNIMDCKEGYCPNPVQFDWKGKKMDILTTETSAASDGLVGYTGFLLVLASFTLILGGVICCARIAFMYCTFRRRREEELERARRTARSTASTETEQGLSYPRACGIANHGFDDPPPRYDQVYKDDEPPPLYETLGSYGNVQPNSAAGRRSTATANEHTTETAPGPRAHERAPSYSVYIPPDSRAAPPRQDSVSEVTIPISTASRQIQNYMEEVRERFSGNVDLFISSLSITTPPPTSHRSS